MEITYDLRVWSGLQYLLDALAPCTPYGAERVRSLRLYTPGEREALEREWRNVRAVREGLEAHPAEYARLSHLMMQVRDLRGTLRRCREDVLTEIEMFEMKRFLLQLSLIVPVFRAIADGLEGIALTEEPDALRLLDPERRQAAGFAIGSLGHPGLSAIREEKRLLEARLRQTPEGSARDDLLNERRLLIAREEAETLAVRRQLSEGLRPHLDALWRNTEMLGRLDFTIQKATLAKQRAMAMPRVVSGYARFEGMIHPEIADGLREKGRDFTPVSMETPRGVTVLTGANMGGKSIALRTLTLNVLLCQTGFFACAKRAELPLFGEVHVLAEDTDDTGAGLSSFGLEVVRLQGILERVQGGAFCFVALDEPARGTNPHEGAALAAALAQRLSWETVIAVIATHYDGVAAHAQAHYQAAGLRDMPDPPATGDRLAFLARHMEYGLVRVGERAETPREALAVCRLLGLDEGITNAMEALLREE